MTFASYQGTNSFLNLIKEQVLQRKVPINIRRKNNRISTKGIEVWVVFFHNKLLLSVNL